MGFPIRLLKYKLTTKNNIRYLQPFFLSSQNKEIAARIKKTINYFEGVVAKELKQENFEKNKIIEIFGDYKTGSCILQTLGRYYEFQSPSFDAFESKKSKFLKEGINSPSELRIFLFNRINEDEAGFLSSKYKDEFFKTIADLFAIDINMLETLLWLDDESNQRLVRIENQPPTKEDVIRTFNWHVIDTLVKNSLSVTFQVKDASGTFAKKIHWLCKRYGLFYDMRYNKEEVLHIKIYGVYDNY